MLNEYQKLTARVAVGKAIDKDAEIRKLSANMKVPEKEIRSYLESYAKVGSDSSKTAPATKLQGSKKGRIFWTDDMLRQLDELHKLGNKAPQIAKIMGLDVKQVINRLHRKPDSRAAALAKPLSESKSDKPIVSEVETSQEPKSHPADLPAELVEPTRAPAAPQGETPRPVSLSDQVAQVKKAIRKTLAPFSVSDQGTNEDVSEGGDYSIDMPGSLLLLMKLIHDNFGDDVIRVYASNDEHRAACAFEVDNITYDLRLEVLA